MVDRPIMWDELTTEQKFHKVLEMIGTVDNELGRVNEYVARGEFESLNEFLVNLGRTDFHSGTQDLATRLDVIESCLDILHQSHLGHTNTRPAEFKEMHGFYPEASRHSDGPVATQEWWEVIGVALNDVKVILPASSVDDVLEDYERLLAIRRDIDELLVFAREVLKR